MTSIFYPIYINFHNTKITLFTCLFIKEELIKQQNIVSMYINILRTMVSFY